MKYQGLTIAQDERLYNICEKKNLNFKLVIDEIKMLIEQEVYDSVDEIINEIMNIQELYTGKKFVFACSANKPIIKYAGIAYVTNKSKIYVFVEDNGDEVFHFTRQEIEMLLESI